MNIFRILMSLEIDEFSGMKLMNFFEKIWVNVWCFFGEGEGDDVGEGMNVRYSDSIRSALWL